MKFLRRYALSLLFVIGLFIAFTPVVGAADSAVNSSSDASCQALGDLSPSGSGTCANPDGPGINNVIRIALNLLSLVAGIIAVIMLIISGLKYITSQGDSNQISSAKQALIYVVVGLIIVALAQFIVKFVLGKIV